MSANEHQKAGDMVYETALPLRLTGMSRSSSKPPRRHGPVGLLIVAAGLLLTASLAHAAPNGSNRGGAFRVMDKNNNLVGYTVTDNMVAREINGVWVTFYVHPAVGIYDSDAIYLQYTTTDCTGTAYITHYSTFSEGTRVGPRL